ncbi:MAG: hypothetical protein M1817_000013 [Caeruleum heppii]|nr:MAG: hypothetical protein M1817_000013 [Caeruleum heppii]
MNSPPNSSMDDMIARATLDNFSVFSILTVPGIERLSESEQVAVAKKAEQRLVSSAPLDPDALRSRLQSITPPLDQEEEDEEARMLEAQARKHLESDGCPACYPPHLDVPVRNPPEEYKQIIEYWHSLGSTGDVVLCAQKADWRDFRAFQTRVRRRHPTFDTIIDDVRERRRRHGLRGNVDLFPDLQQQTRQQNWLEFQNYHLRQQEQLETKRDNLMEELATVHQSTSNMNTMTCEHATQNEEARMRSLEFTERTLGWHRVLLAWIEQQRLAMDSVPPTCVEKDSDNLTTLAVASDATPSGNLPGPPKHCQARKRTPGPFHSQRVSKTEKFADAGTKSRRGIQTRRRPTPWRLHSVSGALKTRSGRISKPPVRWVPE